VRPTQYVIMYAVNVSGSLQLRWPGPIRTMMKPLLRTRRSSGFSASCWSGLLLTLAFVPSACGGKETQLQSELDHDSTVDRRMRVLVANDDGYGAAGIDALVEALWARSDIAVTVVAPATNKSGTGGQTTDGALSASDAMTGSRRPATAVDGFPADCLVWAIDQQGIPERPDLVISGINLGENVGPTVNISGTVGAARAAAARKIPALAASEVFNGENTDFKVGAALVMRWVDEHWADILSGKASATGLLENLNVPSCTSGNIRGEVRVPIADTSDGVQVDCTSTLMNPPDDVTALSAGFAVLSTLPLTPAVSGDVPDAGE
jgi:5'-nucleotidase